MLETTNKQDALKHLRSFGLPPGGEGPGLLAYWNALDEYLREGVLTWEDLPHGKATWENGSKKRGYKFTVPYGAHVDRDTPKEEKPSEPPPVIDSKPTPEKPRKFRNPFRRKKKMPHEEHAPDEATEELWDLNKKLTYAEELENFRRNRTFFDNAVSRSQDYQSQLQQLAIQAMQNAIETANLVGKNSLGEANLINKQAAAHRDIAIAQQWRDQGRDNYPADEQFDLGNADDETD